MKTDFENEGVEDIEKNTYKSQRRANPKGGNADSGQPKPMKGTQRTRKQHRKGQTDGEG
ncbi:small acid-soluble spore protein P [Salipaludibacillus daqingensis]|uniref:small acid-soluble spore protein P n=1 Tax=Salipaludibacillus daqingensis TaxID=3041001 RepID=UPI00247662F6|nr:small acid-soluble spore protein P [Salipaludibacillus daqingensis]